jgi:TatD DNase family protein
MWIDTHSHLFIYSDDDLPEKLSDAADSNVGIIISTATDCETARTVIRQCDAHSSIWGAVGISPFDVEHLPDNWLMRITAGLSHPKILAAGEIGIDDTNPHYPSLSLQQPVFEELLACAKDSGLPAIIHSRGAEERALDICRSVGIPNVLFHCYTGSEKTARSIIDEGYHISFSGIITFRNSPLHNFIGKLPLDHLHIETDTPYLAPVPHRGKPNRPALVSLVGERLASIFDTTSERIQEQFTVNFRTFFRKYSD